MTNTSEPRHWPDKPEVESDTPAVEADYPTNVQPEELPLEADAVDVLEQRAAIDEDVDDIAAGDWAG
jgi:hypothetical protein